MKNKNKKVETEAVDPTAPPSREDFNRFLRRSLGGAQGLDTITDDMGEAPSVSTVDPKVFESKLTPDPAPLKIPALANGDLIEGEEFFVKVAGGEPEAPIVQKKKEEPPAPKVEEEEERSGGTLDDQPLIRLLKAKPLPKDTVKWKYYDKVLLGQQSEYQREDCHPADCGLQ